MASTKANSIQHGGKHYKRFKIQPWDAIIDWDLDFLTGNAVKYLVRWRDKGGTEDLLKAQHYIQKLLELNQ
jgi:hypothetical protein